MGKGANGEGGIRQRKDGRWEARYTVQTSTGPKRRTVYGNTRKEAATKLAKAIANREDGLVFNAGNLTVGQYLEHWLNDSVKGAVKRRTFESYLSVVRRHLVSLSKPAIDVTVGGMARELVPDELWETIEPLLPPEPPINPKAVGPV